MNRTVKTILLIAALFLLAGCSKKTDKSQENIQSSVKNIAVFIPGIMEGSPTYEKLAKGVKAAVEEYEQYGMCPLWRLCAELPDAGTDCRHWWQERGEKLNAVGLTDRRYSYRAGTWDVLYVSSVPGCTNEWKKTERFPT